jgi:ABC-2 type transport system ATP-binding protein
MHGGAIAADQLTKSFNDHVVVDRVDMRIEPGSIVGLIGPSGCGKTTTVRLLTGLLTPSAGTAVVNGVPADRMTADQRAEIGYLPQALALFDELSLWENLSFHASMYGLPFRRRRRLRELLEWVELDGDRNKRVIATSGGMQRRLALAAAFVHDPAYIFLDEPTAGIDPILRDKFWRQFRALGQEGRTLLVTTQYVGEASYCDYVGLLADGQLLMFDTPQNLRRAAFGGEVVDVTLNQPPNRDQIARLADQPWVIGEEDVVDGLHLRLVVSEAHHALAEIADGVGAAGLQVVESSEHEVDYDEAYVKVVERHRREIGDRTDDSQGRDSGEDLA